MASKNISRKEFLQVRDRELTALFTFFGEKKLFSFQKELLPHFSWKVPSSERGLYDLPVQSYTFANMYGIKSFTEMICSVLLPELMTLFLMRNEGVDRNTANARIFGTQGGHTLYHTYMMHAEQRGKENEKETTSKKSKRKSSIPKKVIRK